MTPAQLLKSLATDLEQDEWHKCGNLFEGWTDRLRESRPVSVIVPIFNGAGDVENLLDCDALWTGAAEVIFIDDCSTDPQIPQMLREAAQRWAKARVLKNRRNLGFIRTVNRGFRERQGNNDVVVLNSDAVPDGDWLERLRCVAYSRPNVATVSPLSNSAGFFSLPVANQPNQIPEGYSPAACACLLGWIAPSLYEETVATSGFCWFVRSNALDEVGLLDEMLFYRGYAEETDYCLRASDLGFVNLCSLTCYVGHGGAQSFKGEKNLLKKNNANVLKAIQPTFIDKLRKYEEESRIPELGKKFAQAIAPKNDTERAVVSSVGTSWPDNTRDLSDKCLVLSPDSSGVKISFAGVSEKLNVSPNRTQALQMYLAARLCPRQIFDQIANSIKMEQSV